jgi:hypothetical protein
MLAGCRDGFPDWTGKPFEYMSRDGGEARWRKEVSFRLGE